ncbi:TetR/AcrR family transcriptional regulator [Nocardioides ungokensis]
MTGSTTSSTTGSTTGPARARRGRRPGAPDTRAAILGAARELFASSGYGGTSIRAVAAAAGVDAALVHHYFGTKDDLFLAALQLPIDPRSAMLPVLEGGLPGAGERLLRVFLGVWDDEQNQQPLLALVRGLAEPSGQRLVRDGVLQMVLGPVGRGLGIDDPERRMALVASQMVGVVILRYLLRAEPLASMAPDELVAAYAPTLQRYLSEPLA